jgi:hypothetical protein
LAALADWLVLAIGSLVDGRARLKALEVDAWALTML